MFTKSIYIYEFIQCLLCKVRGNLNYLTNHPYRIGMKHKVRLTTVLLSSDNDSGIRHGFRADSSLPLIQSTSAVPHNTTRLCWFVIMPYPC